jgi:hypothetical protein
MRDFFRVTSQDLLKTPATCKLAMPHVLSLPNLLSPHRSTSSERQNLFIDPIGRLLIAASSTVSALSVTSDAVDFQQQAFRNVIDFSFAFSGALSDIFALSGSLSNIFAGTVSVKASFSDPLVSQPPPPLSSSEPALTSIHQLSSAVISAIFRPFSDLNPSTTLSLRRLCLFRSFSDLRRSTLSLRWPCHRRNPSKLSIG